MPLKIFQEKEPPSFGKIIAVAAGKGGVGKSTAAATLALALECQGLKVGLLDADLYGPSQKKMVPEDKAPRTANGKIQPALRNGLKIMSMAYFEDSSASSSLRAPMAVNFIENFLYSVEWGKLDVLVIDMPPGTGDIPLTLCQKIAIHGVLLVTTPQEIAVQDVRKAASLFQGMGVQIFGIIENMSYFGEQKTAIFGSGGGAKLSSELKCPLLAQLPLEPDFCRFMDQGFNIFKSELPSLKTIQDIFHDLAKRVSSILPQQAIQAIEPAGPHAFTIRWSDNCTQRFHLNVLQQNCPCAFCKEHKPILAEQVTAKGISLVGQYALKIDFSKGCKNGIFTFDFLKSAGELLC